MLRDFAEMLSALSAAGVEYLVVGAYALGAHGYVRATSDFDVWIRPSRDNAARTIRALQDFGAPLFDLTTADLIREDMVFQIGVAPARIDIITGVSGVSFDEAWPNRLETELGGVRCAAIGLTDLARNKAATGRTKDKADLEWIRKRLEK